MLSFSKHIPTAIENFNTRIVFGALIALFMLITPWDRMLAEKIWFVLSLTSIGYLIFGQSKLSTPNQLIHLNWIFVAIFTTSVVSFIFSPLEDLEINALEPDVRWLLFIPIVIATYKSQVDPKWVLASLCIYCASAFWKGFSELQFGDALHIRAQGDENANPFGMHNAMITIMLIACVPIAAKSRSLFLLICLSILLGIFGTFFTGTRTALFTLFIGVASLILLKTPTKSAVGTILIFSIGSALFLSYSDSLIAKRTTKIYQDTKTFFTKGTTNNSASQRLEQWRGSICVFKKHPLFGTGPRSAKEAFKTYGGPDYCSLELTIKPGPRQTHSIYFNTLLTLGILGIMVFSYFFSTLFKISKVARNQESKYQSIGAYLLIMFCIAILVNGIALDMWFRNYMLNKNLIALLLPIILLFHTQAGRKLPTTK